MQRTGIAFVIVLLIRFYLVGYSTVGVWSMFVTRLIPWFYITLFITTPNITYSLQIMWASMKITTLFHWIPVTMVAFPIALSITRCWWGLLGLIPRSVTVALVTPLLSIAFHAISPNTNRLVWLRGVTQTTTKCLMILITGVSLTSILAINYYWRGYWRFKFWSVTLTS